MELAIDEISSASSIIATKHPPLVLSPPPLRMITHPSSSTSAPLSTFPPLLQSITSTDPAYLFRSPLFSKYDSSTTPSISTSSLPSCYLPTSPHFSTRLHPLTFPYLLTLPRSTRVRRRCNLSQLCPSNAKRPSPALRHQQTTSRSWFTTLPAVYRFNLLSTVCSFILLPTVRRFTIPPHSIHPLSAHRVSSPSLPTVYKLTHNAKRSGHAQDHVLESFSLIRELCC